MEEGRVIGFVMERIAGARHATIEDLEVCREKLCGLHRLGVLHGDFNRFNFLIRDGCAVLVDFECAGKCEDAAEFERERDMV